MTDKFKEYMKSEILLEEDFDTVSSGYDNFFTEVGELLDSLDSEDVSDDTHDLIDELVDKIFDVIISLGDEDFDEDTEEQFMDIVHMLNLDDEIDEGLSVKSRKIKSGRKRSQKSRLKGSDKLKYLKNLKKKRKDYKKNASLRKKTKKKSKRYRKTAQAKNVARKYKSAQGGK